MMFSDGKADLIQDEHNLHLTLFMVCQKQSSKEENKKMARIFIKNLKAIRK